MCSLPYYIHDQRQSNNFKFMDDAFSYIARNKVANKDDIFDLTIVMLSVCTYIKQNTIRLIKEPECVTKHKHSNLKIM